MEKNEIIREQIFETITNQIKQNDPPETKATFERLKNEGYEEFQVMQMIGQCLSIEIFNVMKHGIPYNNEQYINNLLALPKEPFDE